MHSLSTSATYRQREGGGEEDGKKMEGVGEKKRDRGARKERRRREGERRVEIKRERGKSRGEYGEDKGGRVFCSEYYSGVSHLNKANGPVLSLCNREWCSVC